MRQSSSLRLTCIMRTIEIDTKLEMISHQSNRCYSTKIVFPKSFTAVFNTTGVAETLR